MDHSKDDSTLEANSQTSTAEMQVYAQSKSDVEDASVKVETKKLDNHFLKVLAAVKRAMDIVNGEEPKLSVKSDKKSYIALKEIDQNLLDEPALLAGFFNAISNKGDDSQEDESDDYSI